jgi:hypothetical protein
MRAYVVALFCVVWLVLASTDTAEKPTRSECIIGFNMDWSKVKSDRYLVRNSFVHMPPGNRRIARLTSRAMSDDRTRLYFQFAYDCEKQAEMAATLIEYWRSEGLDLPRFERIEGTITPSVQTIDVQGPFWRDRDPPGGLP